MWRSSEYICVSYCMDLVWVATFVPRNLRLGSDIPPPVQFTSGRAPDFCRHDCLVIFTIINSIFASGYSLLIFMTFTSRI